MPKVLVTGGAGYFGTLLSQQLMQQGAVVRTFDLNLSDALPSSVEQIQGDVLDEGALARACAGVDVVYHSVAQVPLAKDVTRFWAVNRDGTANVIRSAQSARVKTLVYLSSSAIFGVPESNPVREMTFPNPAEDYGQAKLAGEQLCLMAAATSDLRVQIIRPRTILGHGRLGIFQILFEWIYRGYNIPVLGRGDNVYQFVHAEDLADACIRAAAQPTTGIYNCGSAEFGTMRETLTALCEHAGTGARVKGVPEFAAVAALKLSHALGLSPLGPYHWIMYGKSLYFDVSHAKQMLGWTPRYSNADMMKQNYDWYVLNRDRILNIHKGSHHQSSVKTGALALARFF